MSRLYFDHNASSPADPRVVEKFARLELDAPGNPGSLHGLGRAAREVLEAAREEVATLFGLRADDVVFVSGGTEANNLAVKTLGNPGAPALCADLEHPSVLEAAIHRGRHPPLPVDERGFVQFTNPETAVGVVCVTHGQNEVGTVQDVAAAHALARELDAPLHVDAAQTAGRLPLDGVVAVADTIALSAHKFGGLRGCGMLIGPGVARLEPILHGGGQEFGKRSGTPSPALAGANAFALSLAIREVDTRAARMAAARAAFEDALTSIDVRVITPREGGLPNTSMCYFAGVEGRSLLPALDIAGVEASQGSACSSGSPTPPRVLRAMGFDDDDARRCVRFSFSASTSEDDAREGARRVIEVVTRLAARSRA